MVPPSPSPPHPLPPKTVRERYMPKISSPREGPRDPKGPVGESVGPQGAQYKDLLGPRGPGAPGPQYKDLLGPGGPGARGPRWNLTVPS